MSSGIWTAHLGIIPLEPGLSRLEVERDEFGDDSFGLGGLKVELRGIIRHRGAEHPDLLTLLGGFGQCKDVNGHLTVFRPDD